MRSADGPTGPRVAVDARSLEASGIGRYLRQVLEALFNDPHFGTVHLLGNPGALTDFCAGRVDPARVRVHSYPYGFYSSRAQLAWFQLRARGIVDADVHFFPHYDAPLAGLPRASVVTVQDLIHFRVPEAFPASKRAAASLLLRRVVSRAGVVLVTSEATRRDLLERVPSCAPRVERIPLGVDSAYWQAAPTQPARAIPGPFLLCVGNRKPHKNLVAAVEVLARLRVERPELRLVVVGRVYPGSEAVRARAAELGVAEAVVERSSADDAELRGLYRSCDALLFPSLYEGFGLPVLEAMAAGAPVVASDRASVPEVVGDAGLVVDPEDHDALAHAVRRLWQEPRLREELIRRGRRRAGELRWEETTRRTLAVLDRVATGADARALQLGLS
jgi:glycosyltransferase involved in cell wall biosynthesis